MAAYANTCCSVCSGIRCTIDQIICVLKIYGWMLEAYVVDFFQEDLWRKIPKTWSRFFDEIEPEELGKWILREPVNKRVWPLSLLALRQFIKMAEISRDHKDQCQLKCLSNVYSCEKQVNGHSNGEKQSSVKQEFDNLFTKHVKKKKRYEIDILSQVAANCANNVDCKCIVDIGAGMGHLARVLAYRHDLYVTCIEQNEVLLEAARKWDKQLMTSLMKHIPDFCEKKPHHVSLQVGAAKKDRQELADQLITIFNEKFGIVERKSGFGLIGLHPCGDLAATLLKFYATVEKARFICIVGCCYMKLTLNGETEKGYPMSQYLIKNNNYKLSYTALEVACHAIEKHCDKLKTNNYNDLKVHAYRAALECLLIEKNPNLRRTQLKNTKVKQDTTFKEYCVNVTVNLEPKYRPSLQDLERSDVKIFLKQWKRVLIFGTLRLLLAPLVETLVLLDRFLYLSELNLSPSLKAEFDSRISPRNILLVSTKNKTDTTVQDSKS